MYFVYILKSTVREFHYIGLTDSLEIRIDQHHHGLSPVTNPYRPLELAWYCVFPNKFIAAKFEKYLKSGSGRAFAKRHLLVQTP